MPWPEDMTAPDDGSGGRIAAPAYVGPYIGRGAGAVLVIQAGKLVQYRRAARAGGEI